jgi:hypothetical protein
MAFGQAALAFGLSLVASLTNPKNWHWFVQLPLYFAVGPLLVGFGLTLHVRFCRHVDQACPWIAPAWIALVLNLAALVLFVFSEP